MNRARIGLVFALLGLVAAPRRAAADPRAGSSPHPSPTAALPMAGAQSPWSADSEGAIADEARAQRFFELGKQAIASGRFAEARQNFEASLVRVPRVAAAFNLAIAYRGIGMPVESYETLTRIERGIYGPVREDRRDQIRQLAKEAQHDIAYLDLRVTGGGASSVLVKIDGQDVGTLDPTGTLVVPLNPGSRSLRVSGEGLQPIDKQVNPKPGEKLTLSLLLVPVPADDRTRSVERSSVLQSPWFWLGAGVVVAGAAVTTAVVVSSSGTRDPVSDPTFGVTTTSVRFH